MEDCILKMHPKVVLFLIGANDIGSYESHDRNHLKKPVTGVLASLWEKFINHSEVMIYAINFCRYSKAKRMGLVHPILNFPKLPHLVIPPKEEQELLQKHKEKYLRPYTQRLTELIELCRQNAIEPVFITQPSICGNLIDPATGTDLAKIIAYDVNGQVFWEILELYNDVMRDIATRHHVYLIDLAGEMPKNTEYFYDMFHFTNAGCRLVAKIIDQHLEPFLAEKYPQFTVSNH